MEVDQIVIQVELSFDGYDNKMEKCTILYACFYTVLHKLKGIRIQMKKSQENLLHGCKAPRFILGCVLIIEYVVILNLLAYLFFSRL